MLRKTVLTVALLAAAGTAVANDKLQWPTGVQDENDARLVAFYDAQCAAWADDNKLGGSARDAYIAKCAKEMPELYPVGFDIPDPDAG